MHMAQANKCCANLAKAFPMSSLSDVSLHSFGRNSVKRKHVSDIKKKHGQRFMSIIKIMFPKCFQFIGQFSYLSRSLSFFLANSNDEKVLFSCVLRELTLLSLKHHISQGKFIPTGSKETEPETHLYAGDSLGIALGNY